MRPLKRPPNGKNYKTYQSYRDDLLKEYGNYCAYCEKEDYDLDVEHIDPKSKHQTKITDWNNLLLACPTCNRDFKKAWNDSRVGYVFPDVNETFEVFHYHSNGLIEGCTSEALKTIELCGLDRDAAMCSRADTFKRACAMKLEIAGGTRKPEHIEPWFQSMKNWSVWMTVFWDMPAVITLLCNTKNFPGTRPQFKKPINPPKLVCPPP